MTLDGEGNDTLLAREVRRTSTCTEAGAAATMRTRPTEFEVQLNGSMTLTAVDFLM